MLGPRILLYHRKGQRHGAVGRGNRVQPVARAKDQAADADVPGPVDRAPAGHQQYLEGAFYVDGKAGRAALVGFEAVAEPAVGVSVGPNGIDHARRVGAIEQHGGETALDQAPLTVEKGPARA